MTIETVRKTLLRCAIINYGILLVWFIAFMLAHDWMHTFHGRWFRLTIEQFDLVHYAGMAVFKIEIILLNLVPFVALQVLQRSGSR